MMAYGCLNGGTLSGKYRGGAKPEGSRHTLYPKFQARYHSPKAQEATAEYCAIAEKHGLTPTELALAWANGRFYMGAVIIGATSVAQLEECVRACCEAEVPKEALAAVEGVHLQNRNPNVQD